MCQTKSTQKTNQDTIAVSACGDAWGEGGQTRTGARPTRFTARPLFCARAGQRVAYTHTYATTCCCIIDCSVRISNRRSYQNKGFLAIYFLHNGKFVTTALMVWSFKSMLSIYFTCSAYPWLSLPWVVVLSYPWNRVISHLKTRVLGMITGNGSNGSIFLLGSVLAGNLAAEGVYVSCDIIQMIL